VNIRFGVPTNLLNRLLTWGRVVADNYGPFANKAAAGFFSKPKADNGWGIERGVGGMGLGSVLENGRPGARQCAG
jgi:hypothetical protein